MSDELTIFKNGAAPAAAFRDADLPKTRLDDGVGGSPFARVSYAGKEWGIKNSGRLEPNTRIIDGRREPNPNLDIVILKAAKGSTKAWYAKDYNKDAEQIGPDCFSSNGVRPDPSARSKQDDGKGCANCPHNAWGSRRRTEADGTVVAGRGKECADFKKLAIVPVGDIENKIYGGPMLLQVPPASLKRLGPYENKLAGLSLHYAQVHTRINFEPGTEYPLFRFDALSVLDEVQASQVIRMLKHPLVDQILTAEVQQSDDAWAEAGGDRGAAPSATIHVLKPVATLPPQDVQATPAPSRDEAKDEIARLKAELAAAQKPEPEPEPELTAEQKEIAALKAQLAEAKGKPKGGRPRGTTNRTPAVAPTNMDSEKQAAPATPPAASLPGPGNDEAMSKINQTLNRAKDLI